MTCPCDFPRHVLDILRHVAEFCDFLRHVAKSQGHVAKSQGHVASRKRHVAKSQRHVAKFCDLSKCPCDFLRHSATCLRFLRHASSTSPTTHPFFIWLSSVMSSTSGQGGQGGGWLHSLGLGNSQVRGKQLALRWLLLPDRVSTAVQQRGVRCRASCLAAAILSACVSRTIRHCHT